MNIQELQTVKRNRIPIKIIIMNNRCLGMIRHFQEMYFDQRYYGTIDGYDAPDFVALGTAYGIRSLAIETSEQLHQLDQLDQLLNLTEDKEKQDVLLEQPILISINLPQKTYVYPKLSVNRPIEDQDPLLDRQELSENMIIKPLAEDV